MLLDQTGADTGMDAGGDIEDGDAFIPGGGGGLTRPTCSRCRLFGYQNPDGDDFTLLDDFAFADQGSTDNSGVNLKFTYDMSDDVTFTSITDYKDYEKLLFIDVDSAPINQLVNYAAVDGSSITQEFRFNGETDTSRWSRGFYYLNIDSESDNGLKGPVGSFADVFGGAPIDVGTVASLETDSYSIFGQYEVDVSENMTVIGGVRVMRGENDFDLPHGVTASDSFSRG